VNSSTLHVSYGFEPGSANTVRPDYVKYPNGNTLTYGYGAATGIDDNLSRIDSLTWNGTEVCAYKFIGLGTFVQSDYPQPGVRYDLITGTGTNPYAGFDQFGRVINCLWHLDSGSKPAVDQFKYGYDLASNRLWRQNVVAGSLGQNFDELYAYDGLYQLKDMQRGQLDFSGSSPVIDSLVFHETWGLDPTGNWGSYTQDATGSGSPTLAQTRDANCTNEITEISASVGPGWTVPQYDPAGNMTRLPQPLNPSSGYTATWDAWNRLVQLSDGGSVVSAYAYDGLTRRVVATTTAGPRHYYFSVGWQVLEERLGDAPDTATPDRQFVWGGRYIDDCVLRDRSVTGTLDERLYALQDANWTVTSLSNTTGAIQERYAYSAYGVVQFLNAGFAPISASAYSWETLYCGYRYDATIAFYQVRYRWLEPPLGCWLSRDPLGFVDGDLNAYRYCSDSPSIYVDPSGRKCHLAKESGTDIDSGPIAKDSMSLLWQIQDHFHGQYSAKALVFGQTGVVNLYATAWGAWYRFLTLGSDTAFVSYSVQLSCDCNCEISCDANHAGNSVINNGVAAVAESKCNKTSKTKATVDVAIGIAYNASEGVRVGVSPVNLTFPGATSKSSGNATFTFNCEQ
jgi:RHS repeat-associated protein